MSQMLGNKYFTKLHSCLQNKKKEQKKLTSGLGTLCNYCHGIIFTKQNNSGMYMFMNTLC